MGVGATTMAELSVVCAVRGRIRSVVVLQGGRLTLTVVTMPHDQDYDLWGEEFLVVGHKRGCERGW
jgi:hypothetical protein